MTVPDSCCLECGAAADPRNTVCMHCGARLPQSATGPLVVRRGEAAREVAEPPPAQPAAAPVTSRTAAAARPPTSGPSALARRTAGSVPRPGRTGLLVAASAVLVLAAAGTAVSLALPDDSDAGGGLGGGSAPSFGDSLRADSEPAPERDAAEGSLSSSPAGASDPAPTDGPVTCWNGTTAAEAPACPEPDASPAAFAWVFPEVDLDGCESSRTPARLYYTCTIDGVEMNFSRWDVMETARDHYRGNMASLPRSISGGRQLWQGFQDKNGVGKFKSALLYADHPWSMTTYADTRAEADRAHRRYWMRAAPQYRAADAG